MSRPSPYAQTWQLVTSLDRAGWGDLATPDMRAVRGVLKALVSLLPYKSGTGTATVPQIADAACYSPQWTREALKTLEDLGVIAWTRGTVRRGVAIPSAIRIVKTKLVELIEAAWPIARLKSQNRRAETRRRIAETRAFRDPAKQHRRRSAQGKQRAPSTTSSRGNPPAGPPQAASGLAAGPCPHEDPRGARYCALCRRGIAA